MGWRAGRWWVVCGGEGVGAGREWRVGEERVREKSLVESELF